MQDLIKESFRKGKRKGRFNQISPGEARTKNQDSQKRFVENLGSWDMGGKFIKIAFSKDKEQGNVIQPPPGNQEPRFQERFC